MLPVGALRILIEDGTLPHLLIYAVLEWMVIILLFVDGFLAFLSNEIARFFELRTPCLLCTRLDHALVQRDSNLYYNESICEVHKRDISALAYCHVHKRLSDIRSMCQGCLLAFSTTEKDPSRDCSKNVVDDERRLQLKPLKMEMNNVPDERIGMFRCSCCGEFMKPKSSSTYNRSLSIGSLAQSPRTPWYAGRNDEGSNTDPLPSRYTELKLTSVSHSQEDEAAPAVVGNPAGREEDVALLPEEMVEDAPKTPMFWSRNRFFGIPLTDAVPVSPNCSSRKVPERVDILEPIDESEGDGESLVRLKRQATLDSRSLMALYMELDEERSASAVAANNAMAMITRLQAEKAAVQMEALQYQRMMEEQAEYDEEAVQMMKDLLFKREEEMKDLEDELEMYKEEYGMINTEDLDDEGMVSEKDVAMESALDYEVERSQLLGLLRELETKMCSTTSNKELLAREVAMIRERLRAVEGESGFLKHAAITLQRGGHGIELLTEVAQHLRKLRQNLNQ